MDGRRVEGLSACSHGLIPGQRRINELVIGEKPRLRRYRMCGGDGKATCRHHRRILSETALRRLTQSNQLPGTASD